MSTISHPHLSPAEIRSEVLADPIAQAFWLLRVGFVVAPILFGLDKFFDILVDWKIYLAPEIDDLIPGNAHQAMLIVGVVEIVAGLMRCARRWRRQLVNRSPRSPGTVEWAASTRAVTIVALPLLRAWQATSICDMSGEGPVRIGRTSSILRYSRSDSPGSGVVGNARALGARDRGFESRLPDHRLRGGLPRPARRAQERSGCG